MERSRLDLIQKDKEDPPNGCIDVLFRLASFSCDHSTHTQREREKERHLVRFVIRPKQEEQQTKGKRKVKAIANSYLDTHMWTGSWLSKLGHSLSAYRSSLLLTHPPLTLHLSYVELK